VGAVATDGSRVVGEHSRPTVPSRGPDAVVSEILAMARITMAQVTQHDPDGSILGIGVGSPGPLDTELGVVIETPNLGWKNLPLRDLLSNDLKLPAVLDNDANCAVVGECWVGAGRDARFAIGMTIGTGIGGGLVLDGKLYRGAADSAGEIGHMTIDVDGRRCNCGNYGCLEAYASGPAIARRAVEQLRAGLESRLTIMCEGDLDAITAQTVFEAARAGDDVALDVVRDTAHYLGVGLANLLNIFNPELVVIMGGVTQAGDALFEPLRREVARRAFRSAVDASRIVPGTLTGLAGVYGAARIFLDRPVAGGR
jgi:glucokinase